MTDASTTTTPATTSAPTTTERVIVAKITRAGMRALFLAQGTGLKLNLATIKLGDAKGIGYTPVGTETDLVNTFATVAIGGGDYLGDYELMVQALFQGPELGWVNEVGIYADDGTLFAIWSEPNTPLAYKSANVPIVIALTLSLSEVPPNSVAFTVGGPSVNITIAGPFADLTSAVLVLQYRALVADIATARAQILTNTANFGV